MIKFYERVSSFFDNWKVWLGPILVYQPMIVIFKLAKKIDWPWWAILLPTEIIGTLLFFGLTITYLILRKRR